VVEAYVLIDTDIGVQGRVASELSQIPGVSAADVLTGPYDVIVRAEAEDFDALGRMVVAKIQAVAGISRTMTCPVVYL
jgi:DNA-binding Lrp family transcriptional regulator